MYGHHFEAYKGKDVTILYSPHSLFINALSYAVLFAITIFIFSIVILCKENTKKIIN